MTSIKTDDNDLQSLRTFLKQHKDYPAIYDDVSLLLNDTYLFNMNWDMEPCLTPYHYDQNMQHSPNGDEEWFFMLNRQNYLIKYIIVYLVEQDRRYINKLKDVLLDYEVTKDLFIRPLDTGMRCINWIKIIHWLIQLQEIDEQELTLLYQSLNKQVNYMIKEYKDKYTSSNWGLFQTSAILCLYATFHENLNIKDAYEFACEEFVRQVSMQILDDGTHCEQSFLYHVNVFKVLLDVYSFDQEQRPFLQERLLKMAHYIKMMTTPDGKCIALGDSDCLKTSDVLLQAAIVLEQPQLMIEPCSFDIYVVMETGYKAYHDFQHSMTLTQNERYHFQDSGHVCIKKKNTYLFFKNGSFAGGHSHSDLNSLCFYVQGQPVFIDPGRYSYVNNKQRRYLKSGFGHSGCIIDGRCEDMIGDSWSYERYPKSISCFYQHKDEFDYIEGWVKTHHSLWKRQIIMLDDLGLLIVDDIECVGQHQLSTGFIIDESTDFHQLGLKLYSQNDFKQQKTIVSKRYNECIYSKKLVKKRNFQDRVIDYTLLVKETVTVKERHVKHQGQIVNNGLGFVIGDCVIGMIFDDFVGGDKFYSVAGHKMKGKCVVINNHGYICLKY